MVKRFAILILLVVISGNALAGVPLHKGEQGCAMTGMPDCCATAQVQSGKPQVMAARLCCALNCSEPGTTGNGSAVNVSPQGGVALHGALVSHSALVPRPKLTGCDATTHHQQNSHPAYIRHLALLI